MNKQTDMDHYLYMLCQTEGVLIDDGGGGQFSGGYYEEVYKMSGHIYTFLIDGEYVELLLKVIDYD